MEKTFSSLENDSETIQKYKQDYNKKQIIKNESIVQELKKLGYYTTNNDDTYEKSLNKDLRIKAMINGTGVMLHLANEKGDILTNVEEHIYPSEQIDNPLDISKAEHELKQKLSTASSNSSSLTT